VPRPTRRSVLAELRSIADPTQLEGMARFGIRPARALGGITMPTLRAMAQRIGRDHELALELWCSGIHEARILAALVDDPAEVTDDQMERWVADLDSWDVCDQVCCHLFDRTTRADRKALEWSARPEEFVRRAGFALMACLAVHDKRASDEAFLAFLPAIEARSGDERNFVKKAVNWALRQIGKRNSALHAAALESAHRIRDSGTPSGRWIASAALRELTSDAVRSRLG
jgi:3-methyladenine DNA glycosylase AlkD